MTDYESRRESARWAVRAQLNSFISAWTPLRHLFRDREGQIFSDAGPGPLYKQANAMSGIANGMPWPYVLRGDFDTMQAGVRERIDDFSGSGAQLLGFHTILDAYSENLAQATGATWGKSGDTYWANPPTIPVDDAMAKRLSVAFGHFYPTDKAAQLRQLRGMLVGVRSNLAAIKGSHKPGDTAERSEAIETAYRLTETTEEKVEGWIATVESSSTADPVQDFQFGIIPDWPVPIDSPPQFRLPVVEEEEEDTLNTSFEEAQGEIVKPTPEQFLTGDGLVGPGPPQMGGLPGQDDPAYLALLRSLSNSGAIGALGIDEQNILIQEEARQIAGIVAPDIPIPAADPSGLLGGDGMPYGGAIFTEIREIDTFPVGPPIVVQPSPGPSGTYAVASIPDEYDPIDPNARQVAPFPVGVPTEKAIQSYSEKPDDIPVFQTVSTDPPSPRTSPQVDPDDTTSGGDPHDGGGGAGGSGGNEAAQEIGIPSGKNLLGSALLGLATIMFARMS